MSLNPDIRDQAYQFFIEEAQELLQVLEDGLLNLKNDHSTSKVHELMRAAHSIKGGAASVELETIKLIAHRLEDFFKALYSEKVDFDANLESLLLQAYDGLREPLTAQMEMGSFDEEAALLAVEPIFSQLEEILGEALQEADNYIPSATDLGVDIVASIFEIDVQQSLENLASILNEPSQFDVLAEFQEQLEVLGGFAELFTLPGFSEIIELGNLAIANNPQRVIEILPIFLVDCQQAREVILNGDRDRGGEPSAELIAFSQAIAQPEAVTADSSALNLENSWETMESDGGLEDLFGENLADNPYIPNGETNSDFDGIEELFGEPLTNEINQDSKENSLDFAYDNNLESETDDANVFDFETDDNDTILDWGNLPLDAVEDSNYDFQNSISETESSVTEGFAEETFTEEQEDFATLELGAKILSGEVVSPEPESFSDSSSTDEFFIPSNPESVAEESEFPAPENLETALNSIEEIFQELPPAKTEELLSAESTPKQSPPAKTKQSAPVSKAPVANQLSVRVDLERLERMNNLIGELIINRNSLSLQNEQLQTNVKNLTRKFNRFRTVTTKLRELSDRMLIESETYRNPILETTAVSSSELEAKNSFDSLEMDSYNRLQLLLQDILEEILQLEEGVDDVFLFARQSDRTINTQRQMLGQMRDELMWARMLPLEQILKRFPRTLRDLSNKYQKPVNLNLIGTGVLVDKAVLEKLYDPLLHLLRNGFDHGIEPPEEREKQGKSPTGNIEIHAYYQGDRTIIEVRDDGKGLDIRKIAKKAVKKDLISPAEVELAAPESLFNLIFEPGFSTAEKVSELSGRGVGMSVVREQIESLNGSISVRSQPGMGSTFTLALPLTLTIAKLLVVSLADTAFALPSDSIEEIIIPLPKQLKRSGDQRFFDWNEQLVPIYNLQSILQYNCSIIPLARNSKIFDSVNVPEDWALPLLLLRKGKQFFALEIERLIIEQELVIKPFDKTLTAPNYLYGCTILGDGTLVPVINGVATIGEILGENTIKTSSQQLQPFNLQLDLELESEPEMPKVAPADRATQPQHSALRQFKIMIVDDSTALRKTMALSLERQGYHILQAKDGRDAVDKLQKSLDIDLIVCDIEMPHMNGFEFLGVRRRDSEMRKIPVIMLTSRSGIKHRNLATQLGANGYFTKPYVEQEFLKELHKFLDKNKNLEEQDKTRVNKSARITNRIKILIIDDSSALRKTISLSLENQGYRVLEARDGEEGLEKMQQNKDIALVICDIEMPKMNGFGLLERRRQDSQLLNIPVAMLTSRNSEKHRNLANQLGANAYFTKPYVENIFMAEIANLVRNN